MTSCAPNSKGRGDLFSIFSKHKFLINNENFQLKTEKEADADLPKNKDTMIIML